MSQTSLRWFFLLAIFLILPEIMATNAMFVGAKMDCNSSANRRPKRPFLPEHFEHQIKRRAVRPLSTSKRAAARKSTARSPSLKPKSTPSISVVAGLPASAASSATSLNYLSNPNPPFYAVAAGEYFTVLLLSNGSVVAFGNNDSNQSSPPLIEGCTEIKAGRQHALCLLNDGTIKGWGDNSFKQLDVPLDWEVDKFAAGEAHSVFVLNNKTIAVVGGNRQELKDVPRGLKAAIEEGETVVELCAGWEHNLVLLSDGRIFGKTSTML